MTAPTLPSPAGDEDSRRRTALAMSILSQRPPTPATVWLAIRALLGAGIDELRSPGA